MTLKTVENLRASFATTIEDQAVYGRVGYVYGYPHKKAYRPLPRPRSLTEVWRKEPADALFCYVHLPFCNQRCSFCNLFTFVPSGASPTGAYLDALAREMDAYARLLKGAHFRRLYVGGGTPTYLTNAELCRLVGLLRDLIGIDPARAHGCIEASPETLDEDKIALLKELGFQRLSLGVQSFVPEELRQVNRRFDFALNEWAVDAVGRAGFAQFNVDLIYGLPGQTEASWLHSLERASASAANSLFLYPLYIRPLTGLDRRAGQLPCPTPPQMGRWYDLARERLTAAGFRQLSMRQFRRGPATGEDSVYECQRDGMIGLGAGARSYTRRLHYSTPWKMLGPNIRGAVEDYCRRMAAGDVSIGHGFELDDDEQQRRFVILSLLSDGLDLAAYSRTFATDARTAFAEQWHILEEEGCLADDGRRLRLTSHGVRHADAIGQLFFSGRVLSLMESFEYDR